MVDPFLIQIFIERNIGELLEKPAEVILGKTGPCSYEIQGEIFGAVLVDVVADIHELIHVFTLFAAAGAERVCVRCEAAIRRPRGS